MMFFPIPFPPAARHCLHSADLADMRSAILDEDEGASGSTGALADTGRQGPRPVAAAPFPRV